MKEPVQHITSDAACLTCEFYRLDPSPNNPAVPNPPAIGRCHYYPPTSTSVGAYDPGSGWRFPIVQPTDFCAQYLQGTAPPLP